MQLWNSASGRTDAFCLALRAANPHQPHNKAGKEAG